ncbi:MAG: hypothetical protein IIC07_01850, partial [Proteobacteria bacterium]|nr:hypothetical protein [Pseudomonadota bacterium]
EGDVAVFDRHYCSFMLLAMLSLRGVQACARLHQRQYGQNKHSHKQDE